MIPKVIHYCWFGRNPLPQFAQKCIKSWEKFLPDYQIVQWNEDNFDVNMIPYIKEAYQARKYAFVSDYARFWILYKYGGIYFDTDVEVIRPMKDIIQKGAFMGIETNANLEQGLYPTVAPGLGIGAQPGNSIYKELLEIYSTLHFLNPNGSLNETTIVSYTSEILKKHGLKIIDGVQHCGDILIYPKEYFCPLDYFSNKLVITPNTYTIHHYSATWQSPYQKIKNKIVNKLNPQLLQFFLFIKSKF